jgi:hypothetical protein
MLHTLSDNINDLTFVHVGEGEWTASKEFIVIDTHFGRGWRSKPHKLCRSPNCTLQMCIDPSNSKTFQGLWGADSKSH